MKKITIFLFIISCLSFSSCVLQDDLMYDDDLPPITITPYYNYWSPYYHNYYRLYRPYRPYNHPHINHHRPSPRHRF